MEAAMVSGKDYDVLMTIEEVAEMVRRPVATLRKWRAMGEGPAAFRIGKILVYRRSIVVEWIQDQEAKEA
jgi:uncharacterized protein YlzI (FlbEa/FlbD family)